MTWLKDWAENPILVGLAAVSSVIGLILSIILIIVTSRVNYIVSKKIKKYSETNSFNNNRNKHKKALRTAQLLIQKDKMFNEEIIGNILNELNELNNYKTVLNYRFKYEIKKLKGLLVKDISKVNKDKVGKQLSYFISRCSKEEENF